MRTDAPPVASAPIRPAVRVPGRLVGWLATASAGVVVGLALSIWVGSEPLAPAAVWHALWHRGEAPGVDAIVWGLRVPRTELALVTGCCLGAAGALMQIHTRNPLADPGLLGVTSGGALGAVLCIVWLGATRVRDYMWGTLLGAVVAAALVVGLARCAQRLGPIASLVLVGATVAALSGAATSAVVLSNRDVLVAFRSWSVGSLAGRDVSVLHAVLPFAVLGAALCVLHARALPSLALGDEVAASLGVAVRRERVVGMAATALLCAAATAAVGAVGFVGLLAPHLARRCAGAHLAAMVVLAALWGAVFMLLADVAGRLLLGDSEVPVGVMLALVGAPVFVALARRIREIS